METEIKLSMPEASRPIIEAHPSFAGSEARQTDQISTYYDTPDLALRRRGVVVRIRQSGDGHVQTVKWPEGSAGFGSRGEAEWPVGPEGIDGDALARDPQALGQVADDLDRLGPVFTTRIARTTRLITLDGKTTVEAAVDTGEATAKERRAPISEVELELKGGPAAPMFRLAAELAGSAGLRFGPESKAERGYGLLTDEAPPRFASTLRLRHSTTFGEALPLMVAAGCRDFAADLSNASRGEIEGIHRLRAAVRRLRMLLTLFAPHLDAMAAAGFDRQLRDLGRVLGAGRDWDVFLGETLPAAEAKLGRDSMAPLREAAAARDRDAHAAITAAVAGPLPTELLLGLSLWAAEGRWSRAGDGSEDRLLIEVVPDLLDRLEHKAMRRGRHLASRGTEDLHDLRKALKKLRYASEDVSPLFKPKAASRYLGQLKKVLSELGRINDAAVTATLIDDLGAEERPDVAASSADLVAWIAARRRAGERELRGRWRKLKQTDPFWS